MIHAHTHRLVANMTIKMQIILTTIPPIQYNEILSLQENNNNGIIQFQTRLGWSFSFREVLGGTTPFSKDLLAFG